MFLKNNYEVDFRKDKSSNSLLGFHSKLYTSGYHESQNIVNILTVNSILVSIDIISGSYVNGYKQPTIYSFFPDISPGYKIIENPHNLLYLSITADTIHSIIVWLTDLNGNELNLRGENLSLRIYLREIKKNLEFLKWHITSILKCKYQKVKKTISRKHLNLIASLSQFVSSFQIYTVKRLLP